MRVMVIVKATNNSEAGVMPSKKLVDDMGKFNQELASAGIILAGDGLHPSSKGKRVRFSGGKKSVIDGPFAETKELVAGYWVWQVKSMEEALEWVKRCPDPMPGEDSEIEIRPMYEAEDFGEDLSPELRAQYERRYSETIQHVSVTIDRPSIDVYEFASDPRRLPLWAAGLARSNVTREGDEWITDSPMGRVVIRFAQKNPYGVLDHDVTLESGMTFRNPMRVVPNGEGSECTFTLIRQPGMSDEKFAEDRAAIEKDLMTLKDLVERPDRQRS